MQMSKNVNNDVSMNPPITRIISSVGVAVVDMDPNVLCECAQGLLETADFIRKTLFAITL